ncbi:hypothetical protein [Paenibacillus senegalensis]|uniref:hypothetical protein n=1 Tax=Paenibacillus senegalensis TaxID=1465766 RepID=UPI0002890E06|nr:hypothetical protein [Paenibacillus senegalensis]
MKKECLFYFKLNKDGEIKLLRANFMLDQNAEPTVADFIRCFRRLGYDTELSGRLSLTFRTTNTTPAYIIEVTKVTIRGETEETPFIDWERQAILKELLQLNA